MNLQELLPDGAIDALASQLGLSREQAERGAQALLPSMLSGIGKNSDQLDTQVSALGGPGLADNVLGPEPTEVERGNELLGSIFGSKDVSRDVAGQAAQKSGLDPALLRKMLPILAMLLTGFLARRGNGEKGGLGGILGSILGGLTGGGTIGGGPGHGGLGDVLGSVLGTRR